MDQADPVVWYNRLPPITKVICTASFFLTLAWTLELLDPSIFFFNFNSVTHRFQIWRIFTNFLILGKFSFGWIIHMYLWTEFSGQLERNSTFTQQGPGAYLWFIILQMIGICLFALLISYPTGLPVMSSSLLFSVIYYWSRREVLAPIRIYFVTVKGYQLPYALMFIHLLAGNSLWLDIIGWIPSHMYYLFRDILPAEGWWDVLSKTPSFLDSIMERYSPRSSSSASRSGSTSQPAARTAQTWFGGGEQDGMRRRDASSSGGGTQPFSGVGHRLGGAD